ncbi:hypothetical protein Ancab_003827 [Ancistrocladus abbreviatus]
MSFGLPFTGAMASEEQESQSQNSSFLLDCLFCEEESSWDEEEDSALKCEGEHRGKCCQDIVKDPLSLLSFEDDSFEEEDDELAALLAKEEQTHLSMAAVIASKPLMVARREAVEWMMKVNAHYGFSAITLVLAVNYFDRLNLSVELQGDRPWMFQLAAVACLSLASKIEETQVPLLLDFQVECKYVFEARTIQRMELLVLSTLQWRMNPVTPFSYFGHLITRLRLETHLRWQILSKCEGLILSVINDPRFLCYLPSVAAAAIMLRVMKELEHWSSVEHHIHLIGTLKINKDKVDECYRFILEVSPRGQDNERRRDISSEIFYTMLDVVFSPDVSKNPESEIGAPPFLPSPEPLLKKTRGLGSPRWSSFDFECAR